MTFSRFSLSVAALCVAGGVLTGASSPAQAQTPKNLAATPKSVAGVDDSLILVRLPQSPKLRDWALQKNAKLGRSFVRVGWQLVRLAPGHKAESALAELKTLGLEGAANARFEAMRVPNDPLYPRQYALPKIGAPAAWDVTTGSNPVGGEGDVVVGVIDTGVDVTHPDLRGNLWRNALEVPGNGTDDDRNGYIDDVNGFNFVGDNNTLRDNDEDRIGHGTLVSGVIGALGNNRQGVTGVNWRTKILHCKAFSEFVETQDVFSTATLVQSFDYLLNMKARGVNIRVINNSYGSSTNSLPLRDAIQASSLAGIINVAAAGNEGNSNETRPVYPASYDYPGVIAVAATDENDRRPSFSNFGGTTVDIAAPGVAIVSTVPGGYGIFSGTSMSAAYVSGAMALVLAQRPNLRANEAQALLYAAVDRIPAYQGRVTSNGRLNVGKMLTGNIYAVTGRAVNPEGAPLANVRVLVGSQEAFTDRNGFYNVSGLAPGTYRVGASLFDFRFVVADAASPVTVGGAQYQNTVNLVGTPRNAVYTLSGVVRDDLGFPVPNAEIYANLPSIPTPEEPLAVTDRAGRYTISNLPAGRYKVQGRVGNVALTTLGGAGSGAVSLPARSGETAPNAQLDFLLPLADLSAPTVNIYSPRQNINYLSRDIRRLTARLVDVNRVTSASVRLTQTTRDENGFTTSRPYNFRTQRFETRDNQNVADYALPIGINRRDAIINVPLPTFIAGDYFASVTATDFAGNAATDSVTFFIRDNDSSDSAPTFPTVRINRPTIGERVPTGSKAVRVGGTAFQNNGVDSVTIYLQSLGVNDNVTGYYDFVERRWVDFPFDNLELSKPSGYLTIDTNNAQNVTFSAFLPQLSAGRYRIGAFGRSRTGSQPRLDQSQDAFTYFSAVGSLETPVPTAAPLPDPTPTPTPVPPFEVSVSGGSS